MSLAGVVHSAIRKPSKAIRYVVQSPFGALSLLRGNAYVPCQPTEPLSNLFTDSSISRRALCQYLSELRSDKRVHRVHGTLADLNGANEMVVPTRCLALYALVRHHEPETIVETGSYFGHSTFYLLLATDYNGTGHLHSFDAHPHEVGWHHELPSDFEPGYVVPEELRDDWTLHEGDIKNTLRPGLQRIGEIDMFFHDSNHDESHKRFEFELALKHLSGDGILSSHDVGHGNKWEPSYAFVDIAEEVDGRIHAPRAFEPGDDGTRFFAYVSLSE